MGCEVQEDCPWSCSSPPQAPSLPHLPGQLQERISTSLGNSITMMSTPRLFSSIADPSHKLSLVGKMVLSHTKGQTGRPREVYFWKIMKLIYQLYFYPKLIFSRANRSVGSVQGTCQEQERRGRPGYEDPREMWGWLRAGHSDKGLSAPPRRTRHGDIDLLGLRPLYINEVATLIFSEMFQRRVHWLGTVRATISHPNGEDINGRWGGRGGEWMEGVLDK